MAEKDKFAVQLTEVIVTPDSTGLVYVANRPDDLMLVDEQEAFIRADHAPHAITPSLEDDKLRWDVEWTHDQATILGEGLSLPPSLSKAFDFQPLARFGLGRYGHLDMVGIEVDNDMIHGHLVSRVYSDKAQDRVFQVVSSVLGTDELTVGQSPFTSRQLLWEAAWGKGASGANILHKFFNTNYDRRIPILGASRN